MSNNWMITGGVSLSVKVARLAWDLKPEVKYVQFYNNSNSNGTDISDFVGVLNNLTNGEPYGLTYPIIALYEGDNYIGRTGRKIRIKGGIIK